MKMLVGSALFICFQIVASGCSNSEQVAAEAAAAAASAKEDAALQAKADLANAAYYATQAKKQSDQNKASSTTQKHHVVLDGDGCSVPNHADSEQFGLILNANSLLCARVIKVCPLKIDALEVTCVEYRGGSAAKTYIIDIKTATAFEQ